MDERRDPGEFYPGGRVMVRPDVAPPQMQVRWSDIQGKPDLSDVAELAAADSLGTVKKTMNTVINKFTTLLIGALFVVGSAVADVKPLFAKADDIPGNQQVMTNVVEYVEAHTPVVDFSTNNTELVETINAVAPTPGNYEVVSNAAMNALSMTDSTNVVCSIVTNTVDTWRKITQSEWDMVGNPEYDGDGTWNADFVRENTGHAPAWADGPEDATRLHFRDSEGIDVSYERCAYNALGLARLSDVPSLTNVATKADATLAPVFADWVLNPSEYNNQILSVAYESYGKYWRILSDGDIVAGMGIVDEDASLVYLHWYATNTALGVEITATRSVVGYVLGSQTNMVLASTTGGRYALFVIDLNPGETRVWNGIELKATTNNFAVTESGEGMLFYCPTIINGEKGEQGPYNVGTNDWCRLFVLSKRADSDIRRWTAISNTADLSGYAPLSLAVLVSQDKLRRVADKSWLYEGNKELIWSFVRISSDVPEMDQDEKQCWRPIMPVKWYDELPDWADESPRSFDSEDIAPYVAPWLEAIEGADTSYQRFDVTTNVNQSVQYVTNAFGGVLNVEIPIGVGTKDWVMYCNFENNTSIRLPAATWWIADAAYTNAIPANQPTALYFTQVTDDVFLLSRQELTTVQVEE